MPIKFIAIALTLFLGFPQIASPAVIDRVLVVVNDDVITEREFVNSMRQFIKEMRSQGNQIPDQEELEQTVMERLILERIQLQFADGLGIKITDSQVKRAVEGIAAQQNLSVPDFFRRVQQAGLDIDQYQGDVRNQLRIQRVVDREVRQQIVVSPREVELEVQRLSTDQKETEIEYDISHILLSIASANEEEKLVLRSKAKKIVSEIQSGASFESMARLHSDAPDGADGGGLGYRSLNQLPDLFSDAISSLDVDAISDVFESPSGLHILRLNATKGGKQQLVDQWLVRHILISADSASEEEAIAKLLHLKTRIEQGGNFNELAKVHSEDARSRIKGGDLGWVGPGDTMPEFEAVVRNLASNELSEPLKTRFGMHLVQVLEHRVKDLSQDLLKVQAERRVRQKKGRVAYDHWLARVREEAYVKFRLKPKS